ncbi:uncharacterized protein LOC111362230 [Spodoptera litura]|uniref:Uncharacterized protein LOC111362230 n=1 Tax=Spodoptera litura TaxID=69820 RepID=A0A9J7EPB0_SPOLT|nr:uncharacterized protein LOC111362230 [Spodoptera litura]
MANEKSVIVPQGGTGCSAVGESATAPSGPVCPSYSGGGIECHLVSTPAASLTGQTNYLDSSSLKGVTLSDGESGQPSSRFWRKHTRDEVAHQSGSISLSSSEENLLAAKVTTSRRGRAASAVTNVSQRELRKRYLRPDSCDLGHSEEERGESSATSLISTKAELNAAKRQQRRAVAADEVSEMARRARERRAAQAAEGGEISAVALNRQVLDGVDVVLKVATKSGNLKTTFVRALKEAADDIKNAVGVLLKRTASEEVAKLQEENSRLRSDLEDLQRQVAALSVQQKQRETTSSTGVNTPTPASTSGLTFTPTSVAVPVKAPALQRTDEEVEQIVRICMLQCGSMMNARLEAITQRLPAENLRPPLAADRRRLDESPRPAPARKKPTIDIPSQTSTTVDLPGSKDETWATVVGRKKVRKAAKTASAAAQISAAATKVAFTQRVKKGDQLKSPKVRAPRSEAVTVTLQPGAEERGVTYKRVIAEAKAKIRLSELDLPCVTLKTTATGARLFEVPGASSSSVAKADLLAAKLKEVLNLDDVRVSRPTKTAELHIRGLDDSVTTEEVVTAIARIGECSPDTVRAGDIRVDASGLGMIWVRCPTMVAKTIADSGRLLVGWVAAKVKLLQPRTRRCFRCLEEGHVQVKCIAEIDRSDWCYRCGQPGHKAALCSAEPNCSLCTAACRPAGHKLGGQACGAVASKHKRSNTTNKRKKKKGKPVGRTLQPLQIISPTADSRPKTDAEGMECK